MWSKMVDLSSYFMCGICLLYNFRISQLFFNIIVKCHEIISKNQIDHIDDIV